MEGTTWHQTRQRRRRPPAAAGEGLGHWTKAIGLPVQIQEAIRDRTLREEELAKLKSFKNALVGKEVTQQLASSWRLAQVKLTRQGEIRGLPALNGVTGGTRARGKPAVRTATPVLPKPGPPSAPRGT